MKPLFAMSLVCALMSLLAVVSLSAMSIVPRPGVETERMLMMLAAGIFAIAWLWLAVWIRVRQHAGSQSPPDGLRRFLLCVSIVYFLGILLIVIG